MPVVTIGGRVEDTFAGFVDTFLSYDEPAINFVNNADVQVRGSTRENEWVNALVQVPGLGLIEGAGPFVVNSAELHVFVEFGGSEAQTFAMRRALREAVASQANWTEYATGNAWATAGARGALDRSATVSGLLDFEGSGAQPAGTEIVITSPQLAADVQDWLNNRSSRPTLGWVFERTGTIADRSFFAFKSNETADGDAVRPYLRVDYSVASGGLVYPPIGSAALGSRVIY